MQKAYSLGIDSVSLVGESEPRKSSVGNYVVRIHCESPPSPLSLPPFPSLFSSSLSSFSPTAHTDMNIRTLLLNTKKLRTQKMTNTRDVRWVGDPNRSYQVDEQRLNVDKSSTVNI